MAVPFGRVGAVWNDFARISNDYAVARHIEVNIRIGRDKHVVAYRHIADHNGICPYPHSVAYRWSTLALTAVLPSYRYTRCYIAVTPDFRLCVDYDRSVMTYKKAFAYFRLCRNMKGVFFIQYFEPERIVQIQQLIMF